ncbi:MAG: hypothetical protein FJW39_05385 [Acidobacteria bacterium]|nr:hypothetical protein [Acidobacteriota bacterium]
MILALLLAAPVLTDAKLAESLKQRYLAMTRSWTEGVQFTGAELQAMERGKSVEKEMMESPADVMAQRVKAMGEPSWERVTALYPGKLLDRTVLGGFPGDDEFSVWWNCAISARIIRHKVPATTLTVAYDTTVVFRTGEQAEMFGIARDGYSSLRYEDGYLPVLRARYERHGVIYHVTMAHGPPDTAWVRVEIENPSSRPVRAWLHEDVVTLLPDPGTRLEHSDPDARHDAAAGRITHRFDLKPRARQAVYFTIPYQPGDVEKPVAARFNEVHTASRKMWLDLLARGTNIEVPEKRVNDIWRALLLQNFVLADGARFTYGAGLMYNDSYYPVENGFGTHVFAQYGHRDFALSLLPMAFDVSIRPEQAGRKYQNRRALPMHHLLALYRLTGGASHYHRYRDDLNRVAEEIIADRRSTMVGKDGKRPLHWGWLPPDKPGVDLRASTQSVYCPAHNITNCQGLQDYGEFLVATGLDPERGRRYIEEAREFRAAILRALESAAIRMPDRPPFVDLQTLYFRETPDYGPEPYDHLALGRLQGAYFGYWVDMQLQFQFFNPDTAVGNWLADYVEQRGGRVFGVTRARMRPGDPNGWINAVYNYALHNHRLRQGRVDDFLLGFYGRLAFAMSRNTYAGSEGAPLIGYNTVNGGPQAAEVSYPNSAANAETLSMLRHMLVHEELVDNRPTGRLHLLRGVPRNWLDPGQRIVVERAPTYLGGISFSVHGEADAVRVELKTRHPALTVHVRRAERGAVEVPAGGPEVVRVRVR